MIISGKQVQGVLKAYGDNTAVKNAKPGKTGRVQGKDEVVLSPQAQEFAQLLQEIKAMPEVRQDKVRELAKRIEAGSYHVDAKAIAEKMMDNILTDKPK